MIGRRKIKLHIEYSEPEPPEKFRCVLCGEVKDSWSFPARQGVTDRDRFCSACRPTWRRRGPCWDTTVTLDDMFWLEDVHAVLALLDREASHAGGS